MSEANFQHIQVCVRDGVQIATLKDARLLDENHIREVGKELTQLIETERPRLVIDFSQIQYLASAMLGKLITLQRKVRQSHGGLAFCNIPPDTFEVFKISKLDNYFEIYPDIDQSVQALTKEKDG